jgi:hypothetical protein
VAVVFPHTVLSEVVEGVLLLVLSLPPPHAASSRASVASTLRTIGLFRMDSSWSAAHVAVDEG